MKHNCIRCNGELVTIEYATNKITITKFCKECGFLHIFYTKEMIEQSLAKAVMVGEDGSDNKN